VLVVGQLVDRLGRLQALVGGLLLMSGSTLSLLWVESIAATSVALFGLGLGWSFSFVAATAELTDLTAPSELGPDGQHLLHPERGLRERGWCN
jgi:MFS family permease